MNQLSQSKTDITSENFNIDDYINTIFPNELSLTNFNINNIDKEKIINYNVDSYQDNSNNNSLNLINQDYESANFSESKNSNKKEEVYDLDYKIEILNVQAKVLNQNLSRDMKLWSSTRLNTTCNILKCEDEIKELCNIISIIRSEYFKIAIFIHYIRSELSEKMVDDICSDIKLLDSCKSNLLHMITIFKRANMYVSASEQLASMVASSQFESV